MVRIISQMFSPPRSRHSSGETDRDLAERTKLALSSLGAKRFDRPDYESSSDSFWDSELDGEQFEPILSEGSCETPDINGNGALEKSNVHVQRKDRRRERNKLSAQAYRKRNRNQRTQEQQQLLNLESENRRLHKLVETLEKKKEQAKEYLRGGSVPMPDVLSLASTEGGVTSPDKMSHMLKESPAVGSTAQDQQNPVVNSDETLAKKEMSIFCEGQASPPVQSQKLMPSCKSQVNLNNHTNRSLPLNANINRNVSKFNLYPAQILTSEVLSNPSQTSQVFLQTHAGAAASPQNSVKFPARAIPTFVAVPLENPTNFFTNANMNCNSPMKSSSQVSMRKDANYNEPNTYNHAGTPFRSPCLVSQLKSSTPTESITVRADTFLGLVKVDMCNSNAVNGFDMNLNADSNGNNSNCDNINDCNRRTSPSFTTYNLNLNLNANAMFNEEGRFPPKPQGNSQQYLFVQNDKAMAI